MLKETIKIIAKDRHVQKTIDSCAFFTQNVLFFLSIAFAAPVGLVILNTRTHVPSSDICFESYAKLALISLFLISTGLALITAINGVRAITKHSWKAMKKLDKKLAAKITEVMALLRTNDLQTKA